MLKKSLIGSVLIAPFAVVLLYDAPSKTKSAVSHATTSETLSSQFQEEMGNVIVVKVDQNDQQVEPTSLAFNDQGLLKFDPSIGMILADDDPLLVHAKSQYNSSSSSRGIENFIISYQSSTSDKIYGSNQHIYRVIEDANGQWHLFPFNYKSVHMFSQAQQQKYLDGAPESPLEIKHDYIESAIENVVYMHGARDLDVSCKNNICIGAFNRPEGAPIMWSFDKMGAEERMNEVIDRDPYVVGIMNCDIMGQKAIDKEPQDKKDCYIEVRAVYDPTES